MKVELRSSIVYWMPVVRWVFSLNSVCVSYLLANIALQCLIRFSGRNELASEHDKRVFVLYQCLENFFLHGLKGNQNLFNLTRKMISNSLSNSPKHFNHFVPLKENSVPNFWQFVTFFLNKHEIERFTQLKHIKTSIGRCRSWIRRYDLDSKF